MAIVQELQLAAGDLLVIDGVTLRGPTTVDLPKVFFLPPEDMNFTFTSDCHNESRGFTVMYICMGEFEGQVPTCESFSEHLCLLLHLQLRQAVTS